MHFLFITDYFVKLKSSFYIIAARNKRQKKKKNKFKHQIQFYILLINFLFK